MREYEPYIATVRSATGKSAESLIITIPAKLAQYMGLEPDDTVKIMIKKMPKEV